MERSLAASFERIVRVGDLTIIYPSGRVQTLGDSSEDPIVVRFTDAKAVRAVVFDPSLALAEAYMDGTLIVEQGDIYGFFSVLKRGGIKRGGTFWALGSHIKRKLAAGIRQRAGAALAQRNIAHHYDLDEKLFRLFLDADMNYSCAYFEHDGQSLEDAQKAKQRHIAAKLLSKPGGKALDIGSGWGGMGLYLAQNCGLDVTGVTLSVEQQRVANARAAEAGLSDQVRFNLQDYRQVEGKFDHITSIGMLEHVGLPQMNTYFATVARLLDKNGTALIHSMAQPKPQPYAQPFGDKYIFPGGYIPSLGEVIRAIEAAGLLVKDVEILPIHYAETCRIWRDRFLANRSAVLDLYDERFLRMWEMYLVGAEISFRHDRIFVAHFQLARHQDRIPIRRNWLEQEKDRLYMYEASSRKSADPV